jgi:hypothetical protein
MAGARRIDQGAASPEICLGDRLGSLAMLRNGSTLPPRVLLQNLAPMSRRCFVSSAPRR